MLSQGRSRATTQLGNYFKRLDYFGFALEVLLHDTLESEHRIKSRDHKKEQEKEKSGKSGQKSGQNGQKSGQNEKNDPKSGQNDPKSGQNGQKSSQFDQFDHKNDHKNNDNHNVSLLFPHAVSFVEQFPHFLDVVVKCARKTEIDRWPYFFRFCGDPEDLFESCLATGRLETATSYLIILQNMVPDGVSGKVKFEGRGGEGRGG